MGIKIEAHHTPEELAYELLGDRRLTHELMIPGWHGEGPLPVGKMAYLKDEKQGPPSRDWTKEASR